MSNHRINYLDLSPEIRELEDGKVGYFYSPSQLEEIRHKHLMSCPIDQLYSVFNVNPFNKHNSLDPRKQDNAMTARKGVGMYG